jgi:hypothetical protein
VSNGYALKLEKIDLKKTFLIGDQFDFSNRPNSTLRCDSEVPGRLIRAGVGLVA